MPWPAGPVANAAATPRIVPRIVLGRQPLDGAAVLPEQNRMQPTNSLTRYILIGLAAGLATGWAINVSVPAAEAKAIAGYLSIITDVFLRLIKMIIAPLVLSTLTVGIAHMGSGGAVGRTFVRTLAWFITASIFSLGLGI